MKITIDTELKTVEVLSEESLDGLTEAIKELLGVEWSNYMVLPKSSPYAPYMPYYPITYTGTGSGKYYGTNLPLTPQPK